VSLLQNLLHLSLVVMEGLLDLGDDVGFSYDILYSYCETICVEPVVDN